MAMTNEKVAEACLQMARKVRSSNNDWALTPRGLDAARSPTGIDGLNVSSMEHALFMCAEIPKLMAADKREKAMRWLGYLQGALTALGVVTLEEAKKMNMPDADLRTAVLRLQVADAREWASALRTNSRNNPGMTLDAMPTLRAKALFRRWYDATGVENARAARALAEELEAFAAQYGSDGVPAAGLTAAGARGLAASLREYPAQKAEIARSMPTERLRQKAVLWEDACSMEDAEHNATLLAEALEEWAIRTDNGEATFEAADPSRAAVSEDHTYEEKPGWLTPRRARAAATALRRQPDCACGIAADDMPTPVLRSAYDAWNNCDTAVQEGRLAFVLAELLESWADAQEGTRAEFTPAFARNYAELLSATSPMPQLPPLSPEELPTQQMRATYLRYKLLENPVEKYTTGLVLAAQLVAWANAQEPAPAEKSLTNDVTSAYWLSDDRVEVLWNSATPTSVTIHGMPVPIADLRRVLDHCEKLKEAL
jgi:hypothetical protein